MSEQTKPWLDTRLPLAAAFRTHVIEYQLAHDRPYLAALGTLIAATLVFLALSGFVLLLYYVGAEGAAFDSIQFITREVNYGWLIRSFHASGTTMLFAALYLSLFRGLLGCAHRAPGELLWFLKLFLLLLLLLTGYLGYVMADGAMSYWSLHNAADAGSRLSGLPGAIALWFFGGPAGPSTLARLSVLHALLAFLTLGVVALIISAKRAVAKTPVKTVSLHPHYTSQHFAALAVYALIFAVLVFFAPHLGENPLNAVPANPLVVPAAVTPPWYLLPVAGIAGVLPGTYGGIIAVIAGFAVLFALPWLDRSSGTQPGFVYKILVFVLALDVIGLCIAYAAGPSLVSSILTSVFTAWYFLHFLVLTPLATATETK
jgi:ubiquinol-cytochrome c reductase cytochrome b subunit